MGSEGRQKLIHLHRQSPPGRLRAQRTGLLRGVATAQFGPQNGPVLPSPHKSSRTGHRAVPYRSIGSFFTVHAEFMSGISYS